jgi:putative intracellular protease/amidase
VVTDGQWISSRQPGDIPAFNRQLIRVIPARGWDDGL